MARMDSAGAQNLLLRIGVVVMVALWIAEDVGWIHIGGTPASLDEDLPMPVPQAMGLVAQAVIVGNGATAGSAMLSDHGGPPEMVSEGQAYHEDLRVERVLADRVILRQRDDNTPIVLAVVPPAASSRPSAGAPATPAESVPAAMLPVAPASR